MNAIAEYTVPAGDFLLGRANDGEATVEFERFIETEEYLVGYFWTRGEAYEGFVRTLRKDPVLHDLKRVDGVGDRRLYRGRCRPDEESLLSAFARYDVDVLLAEGDGDHWSFHLMFEDTATLSDFQRYCVDTAGVALELTRLHSPVDGAPTVESELTRTQRDTLISAYEAGYFDIPREITLVDLAERLEVSDQAVSERMRRGEAKLVETHLLEN